MTMSGFKFYTGIAICFVGAFIGIEVLSGRLDVYWTGAITGFLVGAFTVEGEDK